MIRSLALSELCAKTATMGLQVAVHSGELSEGGVFVVMPASAPRGAKDGQPGGERYLAAALSRRPLAVVLEREHLPLLQASFGGEHVEAVVVEDARAALGELAQARYGTADMPLRVIGVTGTNGKTTETYLLEAMFNKLGFKTGVIGTVSYRWPGHEEAAPLTTPGCLALHRMLAAMRGAGAEYAFMEVSSHALDQNRVAGINFSGALFTNLTQDHLDYHADMEKYFAAKERLFLPVRAGGTLFDDKLAVANADDAHGRKLLAARPGCIGFGLESEPVPGSRHLFGRILSMGPRGLRLAMSFEGLRWELCSPLVGSFNVMNLLGAQALGLGLGLAPEDFAALEPFTGVSGRLERVPGPKGLNVFVDYAHTPDALVKAISALRDAGFERIVTVFGCGGNRDRTKRPLMGAAVAGLTDIAVLTSDNPRDEDPEAILDDVMPGLAGCGKVVREPDRRAALAVALSALGPNDALLVAGKGHETYQLIKGVRHPFSDQQVLEELMSCD